MSPGLSYAVIRCHAMRAELLDPVTFKALTEARTYQDYVNILKTTRCGSGLDTTPRTALELEAFLNNVFIARLRKITSFSPGEVADFLRIYFCMRLEIQNLTRIMRAKFSPASAGTGVSALIPVEPLHSIAYDRLLEEETIEGFVKALEPTIYRDIKKGLHAAMEHDALWPLEAYLRKAFQGRVSEPLSKLAPGDRVAVKEILKTETDIENALAASGWRRKLKDRPPPQDFFSQTYRISPMQLIELIEGSSLADFVKTLNPTYVKILQPLVESEDISLVRRHLRAFVYECAEQSRTKNDFGFPCLFSLLISFETEKDDLVGLGWGKEQGISLEKLLRYTVLPSALT